MLMNCICRARNVGVFPRTDLFIVLLVVIVVSKAHTPPSIKYMPPIEGTLLLLRLNPIEHTDMLCAVMWKSDIDARTKALCVVAVVVLCR